jgi:hypothetical protein
MHIFPRKFYRVMTLSYVLKCTIVIEIRDG